MKKFTLIFTFLIAALSLANAQNNALNLNGSSNYVTIPYNSSFSFGDFTMEAWINTTSASGSNYAIGSYNGGFGIILGTSLGNPHVYVDGYIVDGSVSVSDGTWHHLAGVSKAGTLYLYVDGVLAGSHSCSTSTNTNAPIVIGSFNGGDFFNGSIDEVRFYNYALSQSQIQTSMSAKVCGPTKGLVAYYSFNQGTASGTNDTITVLIDSSGNGHNGTLQGSFTLTGGTSNFVASSVLLSTSYPTVTITDDVIGGAVFCAGGVDSLVAKGTGNMPLNYNWSNSATSDTTLVFLAGTYSVTVVDANGCTNTTSQSISVNATPTVSISADVIGGGLACGHYDTLIAKATGNGILSYSWSTAGTYDSVIVAKAVPNGGIVTTLAGNGAYGLVDGAGTSAKFNVPDDMVIDGNGNMYVADGGNNAIRKIDIATGVVTTLAGGNSGSADGIGTNAQFSDVTGITYDGAGNIYVADFGNNTIRKIVVATGAVTTIAGSTTNGSTDGIGTAAGFYYPQGIVYDGAGNLYVADTYNNEIRKIVISSGVVSTVFGSTVAGYTDGTGTAASFDHPLGIAYDGSDNLYVSDNYTRIIRKIVLSTNAVTTLAGQPYTIGSADGIGSAALFNSPAGLVCDGNGNLYIADQANNEIRHMVLSTGKVSTLCGSSITSGSADGTGTAAQFNYPFGITIDGFGNLYIGDQYNYEIRKIAIPNTYAVTVTDGNGCVNTTSVIAADYAKPIVIIQTNKISGSTICAGTIDTLAASITGTGPYMYNWSTSTTSDTAFATAAGTYSVIVTDFNGCTNTASKNIIVNTLPVLTIQSDVIGGGLACGHYDTLTAKATGNGILTYSWSTTGTNDTIMVGGPPAPNGGIVTTLAGSTSGNLNAIGTAAQFGSVYDVATDGNGNLYVVDGGNGEIRKVVIATGVVTTLAGNGSYGHVDGIGTAAELGEPLGITYDGKGNLYVTESANDIREINIATGAVTTIAGEFNTSGSADGIGTSATFYYPYSVVCDGIGNLYVADLYNNEIRKVVIATGAVTTFAGSTTLGYELDGTGTAAGLYNPKGITYDGIGNLYVVDGTGQTVRKIVIATTAVTTIAGGANSSGNVDGIGTAARFNSPSGILLDNGNLYITDQGSDVIRKMVLSSGNVSTIAGNANNSGSINGTGTAAEFYTPGGITIDASGNLYVAEVYGYDVRMISLPNNYTVTVTDGNGCINTAHADAYSFPAATVGISVKNNNAGGAICQGYADSLIANATGNGLAFTYKWNTGTLSDTLIVTAANTYSVTITDSVGCTANANKSVTVNALPGVSITGNKLGAGSICIGSFDTLEVSATGTGLFTYKWNTASTFDSAMVMPNINATDLVSTLAGSINASNTNGTGSAAGFNGTEGVTVDGNGNIYVTDSRNQEIRKINAVSGVVTTLAGNGGGGSVNGTGSAASFYFPYGIAYDGNGNLFVSDQYNYEIRKVVIATGVVTTLAGSQGIYGFADGIGTAANFASPAGIVCDGNGNLFVADQGNEVIRQIVIATGAVTTIAGHPGNYGSTDGTGTSALFNGPSDVAYDGAGNLYVADNYNNEIRKVVIATGVVTTIAGSTNGNSTDGIGTAARFNGPTGVTYDGKGSLYVTDANNNEIRKMVIATAAVTTIAGSTSGSGSANGSGSSASFNYPISLAADGNGNLFVADYNNNEVRQIVLPNAYNVVVTDGNGCKNEAGIIANINTLPVVSIKGNVVSGTVICGTLGDTLMATATGNGSFGYKWSTTGTNDTVIIFNAGVYTVTVTDGNGCKDTASKRTTAAALPVITIKPNVIGGAVFCTGTQDTLTANVTGNGLFNYRWSNGSVTSSDYVVSAGTYSLSVTDANGCINTSSESVTTNPMPTVSVSGNVLNGGKIVCAGIADSLKATAAGNGLLSYLWSDAGTNDTATVIPSLTSVAMVSTFAGSTSAGYIDGYAPSAKFNRPYAAVPDGNGNVYVADYLNNRIRKVVIATGLVTTVAGGSYGYADGVGSAAMFRRPTDIAYDGGTNLYVADANNNMIRQIDLTTGTVSTFAGNGSTTSSDGTGTVAGFDFPTNLVYDGSGDLYVSDQNGDEIRQIVVATQVVTTLAGTGSNGAVDGTGIAASFNRPAGITYDGSGKLYIADEYNNEIRQIVISSGVVTTLAGTTSSGATNGVGTSARFHTPYGITYDGNGNLYVADYNNNEIRKVVIATATVTTFAGTTSGGSTNGTLTAARFNHPTDVRYDGEGNLYISEYSNTDIRKITLANTYSVVVTDGNGCKNAASFGSVVVNTLPVVGVSANVIGGATICAGLKDTLMANAVGNGLLSYKWNTSSTSDSTIVTSAGTYTVTVTDGNGCINTATKTVTVNALPNVGITGTSNITTGSNDVLTGTNAISYVWSDGSIQDTANVVPLGNATYTVTGTDANGCVNTATFSVTVTPLGVNSITNSSVNSLYPNPTISSINLTFAMPGNDVAAEVKIIDMLGKEVMTENTTIGNGKVLTLNVGMLAQGAYFVKVVTNSNTMIERFVKQ